MKKTIYSFLIALAAASAGTSCTDERFWSDDDIIGDGEARIAATATFKSFTPGLQDSRTVGTALDGISSLTVYAFDQTGKKLIASKSFAADELTPLENNTTKPSGSTPEPATVSTAKVKFEFPLEYGKYKIYAVANADMTGKTVTDEASLKAIAFDWQSDITKNAQMFGWFDAKDASDIKDPRGFDAPPVTVNKKDMPLTAWLVRLASKITVSYDASKLKGNVFIFLKSVQIKDIPESCTLGESNTPTESQLIHDGEIHYYYDRKKYPDGPKTTDYIPGTYPATLTMSTKDFGSDHSHEAEALFFYENNQGTGKNKGQDVIVNGSADLSQGNFGTPGADGKGDGKIDFPDGNKKDPNTGFKDEKRAGTYIEVKAFYRSNEPDRLGQGEITYRFMLGKDTKTDYNAERNYHYKLTLKFNGYANDVDWHIDYTPEPDIYIPNPYYISYLYDKSMTLPVQVTGEMEGTLTAKITENDWMPYDYENQKSAPTSQYYAPGSLNYDYTQKLYNGFLSLRNTGHTVTVGGKESASGADAFNKNFWDTAHKGDRSYNITPGTYESDEGDGEYKVEYKKNEDNTEDKNVRIFNIPLYTRAKNLVKASGYTGNNPYVSYQRKAKVEFTAKLKNPATGEFREVKKTVDIVQVRRVVNPKGIWRASKDDGVFHVHLLRLETEFTTDPWQSTGEFQTFKSQGPWTAEVMVEGGDKSRGWIKLSGVGRSTLESDGKIHGENGSDIEFDYKPNGTIGDNEVRYGIIKVRYHNLTCEHLIFVRQGYAPIAVSTTGKYNRKWNTFNMRSRYEMATSPCEEGSMFRFLAWSMPINAVNNRENAPYDADPDENGLWIYPQTSGAGTKWSDIKASEEELKEKRFWGMAGNYSDNWRVAMVDDYLDLYNDPNVQYGFGILYDGQADGVQVPVKDAYSYYYDQPLGANGKGRGMRGIFVYNETSGAQIFLPAGASGYGRRKANAINAATNFYPGMLHYANRNIEMQQNGSDVPYYRPLLWDLYRRPGGVYWCYQKVEDPIPGNSDATKAWGWDFNYITFDFYPASEGNILGSVTNSDALFIRCVQRP